MEENFSDTEHISKSIFLTPHSCHQETREILAKSHHPEDTHPDSLGIWDWPLQASLSYGLAIFSLITWNNSSNEILRSLALTGLVTIFATIIGLVGCHRCLRHLEIIKTDKMKQSPGQEALLIFFYFNFLLFCAFLLFGTWCFFYQDDATAWLEAKYSDKEAWEQDFKGISLATVQNNLKLILTIAGIFSILVSVINFTCIYYAMKISIFFETIHTVVQVQNLVIVLISFLVIYAGAIAKGYYQVPWVQESEPELLPQVLMFTGVGMIMVAFLGFFSSRTESKTGLMSYTILCVFLMVNFLIFIVILNFGSQQLEQQFEEKCNEVMPYFHRNFYQAFGCVKKYTQNTTDPSYLTCPKEQIVTVWEQNVGIDVEEQSELFGCLNESCCIAMISFVKGKFNFLAAFSIVAFFFTLVAIMTSQYMYKKIKKYQTQILSHKNDNYLFIFMVVFTLGFAGLLIVAVPEGPRGMPQPQHAESLFSLEDDWVLYDLHVDRSVGLGQMNEEGWLNFERLSLYQISYYSETTTNFSNLNLTTLFTQDLVKVSVQIKSDPPGEFQSNPIYNGTATIDPKNGTISLYGSLDDVNQTLSQLLFRPACILNSNNSLQLNITFYDIRQLQSSDGSDNSDDDSLLFGVTRKYLVNLNLNSGYKRKYRGKLVEENLQATGASNYFKELNNQSDIVVKVSLPNYSGCPHITVPIDSHGVFEFNMSILNGTIPYLMKIHSTRPGFPKIVFDYFVGGFPRSTVVEMGTYSFYKSDVQQHNVTGRMFDAFTNKTFEDDYSITAYPGYGELDRNHDTSVQVLSYHGNGQGYQTGNFEFYNLNSSAYVAVFDTPQSYIKNFQRFYALPSPPYSKQMRSVPLVPELGQGELALVLTWGYSPRDLDIHVEFVASPTILCKCDFSMHQCGGVKYLADTVQGGDKGADVIKFDYIGDYQYLVYISLYKQRGSSPKAQNATNPDVSLAESQAQLKVFAPYYSWPVYIFDVPAAAANPTFNYWTVFCFNGKIGLKNLKPINVLTQGSPDVSTCHSIYGTPDFLLTDVDISQNTP